MKPVANYEEIKENMSTLDDYLDNNDYRDYAKGLIRLGICFVVTNRNNKLSFYPCRFIGYAQNSRDKHNKNSERDGRVVKPIISKILLQQPAPNDAYDSEYIKYCSDLDIKPRKAGIMKRKFWVV